jgi:hypothetical protein
MMVMSALMTLVINILENVLIHLKNAMMEFLVLKILVMPEKDAFLLY